MYTQELHPNAKLKAKVLPKPQGSIGGIDLCFHRRSSKSTDTGLLCPVECLFSSQLAPVSILLRKQRHVCKHPKAASDYYLSLINSGMVV